MAITNNPKDNLLDIQQEISSYLPSYNPDNKTSQTAVTSYTIATIIANMVADKERTNKDKFINEASEEGLLIIGSNLGINRIQPQFANGYITITATIGSTFPINSVILVGSNNYITQEIVNFNITTKDVYVICETAGIGGNLASGTSGKIQGSYNGVNQNCIVASGGITNGSELEVLDSYRDRLIDVQGSYAVDFNIDQIGNKIKELDIVEKFVILQATPDPGFVSVYVIGQNQQLLTSNELLNIKNKILEIKPALFSDDCVIVDNVILYNLPNITISDLLPNIQSLKDAIISKVFTYINNLTIGQSLLYTSLSSIIASSVDSYGNSIQSYTLNQFSNISVDEKTVIKISVDNIVI
jgi:uncharacterized phage protein gp47/JayE